MTLNPIKLFKVLTNWLSERLSRKAKIILAVFAMMMAIIMGFAGYKINDYFENDPNACFACHVHDEANKQWAKSEHAGINCHECHHSSKKDQVKQMFRFAFLGQRAVEPRHGEIIVPRTLCLHCHWERDDKFPNAPDISRSRYHAKHVFNEKIECTKCHGYRTHKFSMEERYCLTCHPDRDFSLPGKDVQAGAKLPMGDLPCLNCHTDRTSTLLPGKKKCLFCHGEEKIRQELIADATFDVKHFLPSEQTISKANKIIMPAGAAMQFDCITCHNPHLEARPNWENCTVKCHANVPKTGRHEVHLQMNLQCKNCHKPHMWKVTPEQAKKECVTCHAYKDPKLFLK
jgi:hypothetical protein